MDTDQVDDPNPLTHNQPTKTNPNAFDKAITSNKSNGSRLQTTSQPANHPSTSPLTQFSQPHKEEHEDNTWYDTPDLAAHILAGQCRCCHNHYKTPPLNAHKEQALTQSSQPHNEEHEDNTWHDTPDLAAHILAGQCRSVYITHKIQPLNAPKEQSPTYEHQISRSEELTAGPIARQERINDGLDPLPGEPSFSDEERREADGLRIIRDAVIQYEIEEMKEKAREREEKAANEKAEKEKEGRSVISGWDGHG